MTEHSAGVIDQRDQLGLFATDVRSEHGVGLPELVGVLHAEGESTPVLARVVFQ